MSTMNRLNKLFKKTSKANKTSQNNIAFCPKGLGDLADCGLLQSLEPRVLYDAAMGAELATIAAHSTDAAAQNHDADMASVSNANSHAVNTLISEQTHDSSHIPDLNHNTDLSHSSSSSDLSSPMDAPNYLNYYSFDKSLVKEIIFVDSNVDHYLDLLKGVDLNKLVSGELEIVVLKDNISGVDQIGNYLNQFNHQIEAVHIVSHGNTGELYLGNDTVNNNNLANYHFELTQWSHGLTTGADLLFYGCNVAQGNTGEQFIQNLHDILQADIAASSNLTGNASLGGDWNLEVKDGLITAQLAFNVSVQQSYQSVLATITVTNLSDVSNGDTSSISNLLINDGGDGISLREAIEAANNTPGHDTVQVPQITINNEIILQQTLHITDELSIDNGILAGGFTIRTTGPISGAGSYEINVSAPLHVANTTLYFFSASGLGTIGIDSGGSGSDLSFVNFIGGSNISTPITVNADNVEISNSSISNSGNLNPGLILNGQNINVHNVTFNLGQTGILVTNGQNIQLHDNQFHNQNVGVAVIGATTQTGIINSTFQNVAQGIDLNNDGITANDPNDVDTGPNNLQNKPVLNAGTEIVDGNGINRYQITGTLNSEPSISGKTYLINYYASLNSGSGSGQQLLGSETVTTDSSGNANLSFIFTGNSIAGSYITAIASEQIAPNTYVTSEFSNSVTLTDTLTGKIFVTDLNTSLGISKITDNSVGLILSGKITEPTAGLASSSSPWQGVFRIRNALDNSIVETGSTVNVDGLNATWTYAVQTNLAPGAYYLDVVGNSFQSNQINSINTPNDTLFVITPAAGDTVPNELGTTYTTIYKGPNTTSLDAAGTITNTMTSVVVVESNFSSDQQLLLTATGAFYISQNSLTQWHMYSSNGFSQGGSSFAEGSYSTNAYVFSSSTFDFLTSPNAIIVDTTAPTGTFNTVNAASTSDFATQTLQGTFSDNYSIDYILIAVAPHNSSNTVANFTTVYQLSSPNPADHLGIPLTGTLNAGPSGGYSIDPGQLNLAPGSYDVVVIFTDKSNNINLDNSNTLVQGYNFYSNGITIAATNTSNTVSDVSNIISSSIEQNNTNLSTSGNLLNNSNSDNGTIIDPNVIANAKNDNQTNEEPTQLAGTDNMSGSSEDSNNTLIGGNQEDTLEEQAPEDQLDNNDSIAAPYTPPTQTSSSHNNQVNNIANDSNSSNNSNRESNEHSGNHSNDSTATQVLTFITDTMNDSINYATKQPVGASIAVGIGALPVLTHIIGSHTAVIGSQVVNSNILSGRLGSFINATFSHGTTAAQTGAQRSGFAGAFSKFSMKGGRTHTPSERSEAKAEHKETHGHECECDLCVSLQSRVKVFGRKEQPSSENQAE
ncbi:MAG: DUF4347 domain-containing protein [Gammaproteobacteria bacterium]|nr:DUF4347 domain-containing protein [Gammaproteobacteria bacterium]